MTKKYKVRRYGYEWGGQRKQWWQKALSTVALLLVAGGIGWFAYEPIYHLVVDAGNHQPTPSSQPVQPAPPPESPAPGSLPEAPTVVEPVAAAAGLPDQLYYLPESTVRDQTLLGAALTEIRKKGGTGVLFDLKNDRGVVLYDSALPLVTQNLALAPQPYPLAQVTGQITAAGLVPVGRLFAFKDSTSTASMSEGAVKYMDSKVNWLDNAKSSGGKAWLNPNSPVARDYILQLVEDAAKSGLSHLVLDGVQFPTGFSLHMATYGGSPDKSTVLADFLGEAQRRAEQNDSKIYPVVSVDAAAGVNAVPYGDAPEKLIAAAGGGVLDVRPEQFGVGVTTDTLTLAKPLLTPYETVKAALAAAQKTVAQEGVELTAMVQAYTSASVESGANMPYTADQLADQVKGAAEAGITGVLYYNPGGSYGTN